MRGENVENDGPEDVDHEFLTMSQSDRSAATKLCPLRLRGSEDRASLGRVTWRRPATVRLANKATASRTGVTITLTLIITATSCGREPVPSAASELAKRLERAPQHHRFLILHRAAGTEVIDCFVPNREFSVAVDRQRNALVVGRSTEPTMPMAKMAGGAVYLHRSLFADEAIPAEWLRLPQRPGEETSSAIRRAIGGDLAAYLLAGHLPAGAKETAIASLEIASDVRLLGRDARGQGLAGYRLLLDGDRLAAVPGMSAEDDPRPISSPPVVVDVWLDAADTVVRIGVHSPSAAPDQGAASPGWSAEYLELSDSIDDAPPEDVIDLTSLEVSRRGRPSPRPCELRVPSSDDEIAPAPTGLDARG